MRLRKVTGLALPIILLSAGLLISADVAATGPGKSEGSGKQLASQVNVNTATEEQLQAVPGVGKVLAKRIVEFRKEHGPFRRLEDIMKVRGIGEKPFQKLRPYLSVDKVR